MTARGAAGTRCAVGAAMLLLLGLPVTGAAQPPAEGDADEVVVDPGEQEAYDTFVRARAAFASGRYEEALGLFQRSYELSGRAALLYNIGLASDRLRHDRQALDAFERYLAAEPDTPHRVQVEARIQSLREGIAREDAERARLEEERQQALLEADEARRDSDTPLVRKWWFWTVLGAVAVGVAVGLGVGLGSRDRVQPPLPGTLGAVHETLLAWK